MPDPVLTPELLNIGQQGNSIISQGANVMVSALMAKANRKWNEKMYEKEKADKIAMWQMENEYNSPYQQMQRLKAAGLNPNLVYGHGATATGGTIEATTAKPWNPSTPEIKSLPDIASIYDLRIKEGQLKLLEQQTALAVEQTRNVGAKADISTTDATWRDRKNQVEYDKVLNQISNLSVDSIMKNEVLDVFYRTKDQKIQIVAEQLLQLQRANAKSEAEKRLIDEKINKVQQDIRLDAFEEVMRSQGFSMKDPSWQRKLWTWLRDFF